MESSSVIILGIALLILMSLVVFSLELFVPLNIKLEMNSMIRPYMFSLEANSVLSDDQKIKLRNGLESIGLTDISIDLDYTGMKFGDWIDVSIDSHYTRNAMVKLFNREDEVLRLRYEKKIFIRKIHN